MAPVVEDRRTSTRPSPCTSREAIRHSGARLASPRRSAPARPWRSPAPRARQELAAEADLRQLPRDRRRRSASGMRSDWVDVATAAPRECSPCGGGPSAMSASSCASSRACRPKRSWPSRCWIAALPQETALERARHLLARLNIPERLWHLSPTTFSGGEQQRVNIARGFAAAFPRPASRRTHRLARRRQTASRVLDLIEEARAAGSAIIAVFHDDAERRRACSREIALG